MEPVLVAAGRFLADKVTILLQLDEKLKAMTDIKRKTEKLKELLTTIDAVIEDVESRPLIDEAAKDLLKKLKYFSYDLEDVVDYYDSTGFLRKQRSTTSCKPVRDFFSSNNQVVFKYRMGGKIKAITESLDSILLQKSILLNLSQHSIHMSELSLHRATHSRNSFDVIGREPEKNMIVGMLTDNDESNHGTVKVISIVGMGGLGKTTLAQLVFHDERVKEHFACSRMWKVVGSVFDPTKILKSVLELATHKPVKISEIDLVRQNLENALFGKKFLLVLDDVWNEDALEWGTVKAALTCGARGSKILVTTRSPQVSSIMGSSNTTHQLRHLSRDDCLSLFQQFAFGDEAVDQNLMEIDRKIVEKCGGVPLAAISLGSMLRSTRDKIYWSSVLNSEIWQLPDDEHKLLAILKLSYDTLPLRSKKCFAFGSLFGKHPILRKYELVKLWIANGFVRSEGNFDAETVGNRVFDDLVMRSFFLLAPSNEHDFVDDSDATECTMHDLMHDLARSVSADVYWNSNQDSMEDIGKRTYHLRLYGASIFNITQALDKKPFEFHTYDSDLSSANISNITQVLNKKPLYLRTLILRDCALYKNVDILEIVFSELKFLRVIDLSFNEIEKLPTSIGNLIHLRYLNLDGNYIQVLPDSMSLLLNLQYLYCDYSYLTHMPCWLSRLINLRSRLNCFVADNRSGACSIIELEGLKLHKALTIKFSENFTNYSCGGRKILKNKDLNGLCIKFNCSESNDKDMLDDLCPNTNLKKLRIWQYGSRQFPAWLIESQLPNLVEVSLNNCRDCEHIPPFGNLQFLKKLVLDSMGGIRQMGSEFHGNGGFPSLQELCLSEMFNLEEWSESHHADQLFPSLHCLRISDCPKLKCMPKLPRIQELEISPCSGILLSCVGRLTSLSVLKVEKMDDMTSVPSGCIRNLTSLTELQIIECTQSLPGDEIQHLEMLRSLTIYRCPSIILPPEILVHILNSLRKFKLEICGKKINLRGQLQHLHTLGELYIYGVHRMYIPDNCIDRNNATQLGICCCEELESLMTDEPASSVLKFLKIRDIPNLTTLPDWLQHLKSLQIISIAHCPQLGTLPRGSKSEFLIANCPQLEERYDKKKTDPQLQERHERNTGDSHEPNVTFIRFGSSGSAGRR